MILISILLLRKLRRCRDESISNRKQNRLWIQSEDSSPATHSLWFLNNGIPLLSECFMCFNFINNGHSEHYYCLTHVVTDALRHPVTCWDSTAGPGDMDLPRVGSQAGACSPGWSTLQPLFPAAPSVLASASIHLFCTGMCPSGFRVVCVFRCFPWKWMLNLLALVFPTWVDLAHNLFFSFYPSEQLSRCALWWQKCGTKSFFWRDNSF